MDYGMKEKDMWARINSEKTASQKCDGGQEGIKKPCESLAPSFFDANSAREFAERFDELNGGDSA